ncbi:hypothetical protein Y032_0056g2672 [Ancylostoma ceylanicum]|uniref:Uncharacterized protein n=1 Tax=Ancylostoma ceylanicum TaxID=53326 RepID=A0A016U6S2_9BILA|nr:hypothetical protein Y032_0056g2672 [Ancylostoma ceylanicum]
MDSHLFPNRFICSFKAVSSAAVNFTPITNHINAFLERCLRSRMLFFDTDLGYSLFPGFVNTMLLVAVGSSIVCTKASNFQEKELTYEGRTRKGVRHDVGRTTEGESREPLDGAQSSRESTRPTSSVSTSAVCVYLICHPKKSTNVS